MEEGRYFRSIIKDPKDLKALERLVEEYNPYMYGVMESWRMKDGRMIYFILLKYAVKDGERTFRTAIVKIENGEAEILSDEADEDMDFIRYEVEGYLRDYVGVEFTYKDDIWRFGLLHLNKPTQEEIVRALIALDRQSPKKKRPWPWKHKSYWEVSDTNLLDAEDRTYFPHDYVVIIEYYEEEGSVYFFATPAGNRIRDRIARVWELGPGGQRLGLDYPRNLLYNERFSSEIMRILPTFKASKKLFYDAGFTIENGRIKFPDSEGGNFNPNNNRHLEWAAALGLLRALTMDTRHRRGPWRESFAKIGVDYDDLIIVDDSKGPLPPLRLARL